MEGVVGTTQDHRRWAEDCVAMAQRSDQDSDKALWLTLAHSWVRLAEDVALAHSAETQYDAEVLLEVPAAD
jgi:hypothetical protein